MNLMRNYRRVTYPDGHVVEFNPRIVWHFQIMRPGVLAEIGLRGGWAIGFMWTYRVGDYSVYRTHWLEVGPLTLYFHAGECEPHNPRGRPAPPETARDGVRDLCQGGKERS